MACLPISFPRVQWHACLEFSGTLAILFPGVQWHACQSVSLEFSGTLAYLPARVVSGTLANIFAKSGVARLPSLAQTVGATLRISCSYYPLGGVCVCFTHIDLLIFTSQELPPLHGQAYQLILHSQDQVAHLLSCPLEFHPFRAHFRQRPPQLW